MMSVRKFFLTSVFAIASVMNAAQGQEARLMPVSSVVEPFTAPEACAYNGNLQEVADKLPEVSRALAVLEQLPITGKPTFDTVRDRINDVQTCLYPSSGEDLKGHFQGGKIRIPRAMGTLMNAHENFHGVQKINAGANYSEFALTRKDAAVANLMREATAVGYELMVQKEAQNLNVPIEKIPNTITTASVRDAAKIFESAYQKTWNSSTLLEAQARETKALQDGGKEVVRFLLSGQDKHWKDAYTQQAKNNFASKPTADFRGNATAEWYPKRLREVFSIMGKVSEKINIVPDEYLGQGAEVQVQKCLKGMGL